MSFENVITFVNHFLVKYRLYNQPNRIPHDIIEGCATHFSSYYGVWQDQTKYEFPAPIVLRDTGVPYLQDKEMEFTKASCIINTNFPVDHTEPLTALRALPPDSWLLGDLPDGWEFLCIIPRD